MKIENLLIQQFGRRRECRIDGFSDALNVIYGPLGSGKTTAIHFIRWMLYGNCDEACHRFLVEQPESAAGSMSVLSKGHRRTITRRDDGSRYGRVAVDGGDTASDDRMASLLGSISQSDFDALFAPSFEQEPAIGRLIETGIGSGFDLFSTPLPTDRIAAIERKIEDYRHQLNQFRWTDADLLARRQRRDQLRNRIESIQADAVERRRHLQREFENVQREIDQLETEGDRLNDRWQELEDRISHRQTQLERLCETAQQAKHRFVSIRRAEIADIDNSLQRAQQLLRDIQTRHRALDRGTLDRGTRERDPAVRGHDAVSSFPRANTFNGIPVEHLDGDYGIERTGIERTGIERTGIERTGIERTGIERTGIERTREYRYSSHDRSRAELAYDSFASHAPHLSPGRLWQRPTDACKVQSLLEQVNALSAQLDQLGQFANDRHANYAYDDYGDTLHRPLDDYSVGYRSIDPRPGQNAYRVDYDRIAGRSTRTYRAERVNRPAEMTGLRTSLAQLRSHITQICDQLRNDKELHWQQLSGAELNQLSNCQNALADWIPTLEARREQLHRELEKAEQDGLMWTVTHPTSNPHVSDPRFDDWGRNQDLGSLTGESLAAVLHTCNPIHLPRLDDDALLLDWKRQHQQITAEIDDLERRLSDLHPIRHDLDRQLRTGDETSLDALRRELLDLEAQLDSAARRSQIEQEIAALENELGTLRSAAHSSEIMLNASRYMSRMSLGEVTEIQLDKRRELAVRTANDELLAYNRLSRGIRDQTYLSLCLALVAAYAKQGVRLPLILNDVFLNTNGKQDRTVAEVLADFAISGHQVLLFTRHRHVSDLFRDLRATFITLEPSPIAQVEPRYIDQVRFKRSAPAQFAPAVADDTSRGHEVPNGISLTSSLASTGVLDNEIASRLAEAGIREVRDFLWEDWQRIELLLSERGISAAPLRRWRNELSLLCWADSLTPEAARCLVSIGITDVQQLSDLSVESLKRTLDSHRSSSAGGGQYLRHSFNERTFAQWIRSARQGRPQWQAFRNSRQRDSRQAGQAGFGASGRTGRSASETDHLPRGNRADYPADRTPRTEHLARAERTPRPADDTRSQREPRNEREPRTDRKLRFDQRETELRFYLDLHDPVVDAPSIGARTAKRLQAAGIQTVEDLLKVDVEKAALTIDFHRIKAETLREWQLQAEMVCRIPQLRGHDAQILVALGFTDPAKLAAADADTLWRKVQPFIETAEGKRIVRTGKDPDRAEVADWIAWAQQARALRAA